VHVPKDSQRRLADPAAEYWDPQDVAAYWGVKPGTIYSYRARNRDELPPEDDRVGRKPRWRPATIMAFQRPGMGWRTDLKGRRETLHPTLEMTPWWIVEMRGSTAGLYAMAYRSTAPDQGDDSTADTETALTALDQIRATADKALPTAGTPGPEAPAALAPGTPGAPLAALEHIRAIAKGALTAALRVSPDGTIAVPGPPSALRAALDQVLGHAAYQEWRDGGGELVTGVGAHFGEGRIVLALPEPPSGAPQAGHSALVELDYAIIAALRQAVTGLATA